ncbi:MULTISPECIES: alpha/beta fold hydrolase [unclassified Rhizobium]|uniref:alpha/beta fold hydrolase n=1 Tax=unclassified Rhizobium TaxID=2613769 RepID=UPI003817DE4F
MHANVLISMEKIEGPQGELAVYRSGRGPRVLFLHADCGRSEQWREVINLISAEFETCAIDFRGHGHSAAAANQEYSFSARAEDALAVVDALGWDRFLIVAHSGGGAAALALAGAHPERVRGVLLIDPVTDPSGVPQEVMAAIVAGLSGPDSLAFLKQYYSTITGADEAVRTRVLADANATTPESRAGVGKAVAEWHAGEALDAYQGPLFIVGADATDGPSALYALRPCIPHVVAHGTGHWLQIERPELVADNLRNLAKRTET